MSFLLSRSIQLEADLVDHLFNSSEKRLARILLLLANLGKEGKNGLDTQDQSGSLGGLGGHDTVPDQFLHEQVPETRPHRI